ncbi:MAG: hypothetical protein NVSMB51_11720 [Solirubrobacteraceae bacterium]
MFALKQLDIVLLALALPLFLLADLPMLGWGAGAAAWLAQRGLQALLARRATASDDPRVVVGLTVGGTIARGWLIAIMIFAAGSAQNSAGLAAAVLVVILFTAYFMVGMFTRPFQANGARG